MPNGFDRIESSCVQDALLGTASVVAAAAEEEAAAEEAGGVVDTALAEVVEVAVASALGGVPKVCCPRCCRCRSMVFQC